MYRGVASATRSRKVVPEDPFCCEFDLLSSCWCAQAKRGRAEMTSENPYQKKYRGKMKTKKTATLQFAAASLISGQTGSTTARCSIGTAMTNAMPNGYRL